jgi:hypothetical protein
MYRYHFHHHPAPHFLLSAWLGCAIVIPATAAVPEVPKDERLDRTVTVDLMRVPLSDLCWVIERRTGVAHRTADAATGDLLADVVGTLTVAQLQQALADVLGVGWKQSGEGATAAYVAERLPAKLAEEARVQAETDRAFGDGLRRLLAAANLPEGAQEQLPRELQHPGFRQAVQLLGDLTPAEQAQVLAGGGVERAVGSLSPPGQARVKQIMEELQRGFNESADESLAEPEKPGAPKLRRQEHPLDPGDGEAWRIRIARPLQIGRGKAMYKVLMFSPKEPGFGLGVIVPTAPPERDDPAGYRLAGADASAKEPSSERPPPDHPQPEGSSWEEIGRDLTRSLGRPVVSDAYRPTEEVRRTIGPAATVDTLESYLDRACRLALNRRWGQAGPVLLFQRCDWATQRRGQIPESQAQRWKLHLIDTGRFSLDHLVEMASLTPYQLPNVGEMMGRQADRVMEHRELLLLWKALPEAKQRVLRSEGLVIRDLPLAVQPRARALVSAALGSSAPLLLANARLSAEQTEEAFIFSVTAPERPSVVRRVELTEPAWWVEVLRKDEQTRVAALRAGAGEPATE